MEKDDMEMGGHQHMKTNRIIGTLYNTNENSAEYFLSNGFRWWNRTVSKYFV